MGSSLGYGQAAPRIFLRDPDQRTRLAPGGLAALRSVLTPRDDEERSLSSLIESEIIPRLMVASGGLRDAAVDGPVPGEGSGQITEAEVAALAPLALQIEADELIDYADRILGRGVPVSNLLVDLLAPAARLLGEYWEQDRCDFVDVTMGFSASALARDAAFSFIYPHLLDGWRRAGAEILPFSPLADEAPDASCDVCWLPGGYPELHGGTLANSRVFRDGLISFAATRPVHGECG
eukprot:gene32366-43242_t